MKKILADYNISELKDFFVSMGEKSFRAEQVFRSIHSGLKFSEMTDLSKSLREKLTEEFIDIPIEILKSIKSVDGTEKFLYKLSDGNVIEGVLMRYKYGNTLCVSTQVGCRMNCAFCVGLIGAYKKSFRRGDLRSGYRSKQIFKRRA